MWIGWIEFDFLLGDVHSLKEKRSLVRPIVSEMSRKFSVSAAEVDHTDLHRRAGIGASVVSADRVHVTEVIDRLERHGASRPEVHLVSVRRRIIRADEV
ncbi:MULTISPECIES: DUF503 domain-containing protein [Williamsia]|uniref:DUF503 domain-containing protein n=1 Tax=Williamsia phyllosphaerae TaxID=885042 RepID=A0ABQ1V8F0_9NOCA|nr:MULTISPECIES: DUF503 domain-containing protein [Williamsia]MBJ7287290.1 DUF503 domain-containing protein [Williamsia sp.]GGF44016.1 hypothetical protein GCM10007298_44720 [Williamsia phyllosphaerae]